MRETALIMVAAGAIILVTRGTLLISPGNIRVLYLRSLLDPLTLRLSGLLMASIAAFGAVVARSASGSAADSTEIVLWVVVAYAVICKVLLAGPFGNLMKSFWGETSDAGLRILGLNAAIAGSAMMYFGAELL